MNLTRLALSTTVLLALTACTKELEANLDQTSTELATEVDRSDGTQAAVEAETARVAALEAEIADLRNELDALKTFHDALVDDVDAANADARLDALETASTVHTTRLTALETDLATTDLQLSDLTTAVNEVVTTTNSNFGILESAITEISTTSSVFDDTGKYLGDLYDARLGSITFFERTTETLVEVFFFDTTTASVWTENDDRLYYLTSNCTGTPYMNRDAIGPLGVLDQNNGKIYTGVGNWTTATLRSYKGLWKGSACSTLTPIDYTVVEYSLKGTLTATFPVYIDTGSLSF